MASVPSNMPEQAVADIPVEVSWPLRAFIVVLGFSSVASLLGWVYGLASFAVLFRMVTLPGAVLLVVLAVWSSTGNQRSLGPTLVLGTVAGMIGTLGYDVFRMPFVFGGGFLLLSPVETYGVLASGAHTSSGWTDFVGWAYHLSNGIGFGIAYAAVAQRRNWRWGVLFAMLLETGTVLTPFASTFQLQGKYFIIAIAYAAHVPFGIALGKVCEDPDRSLHLIGVLGRRTASTALAATVVALAVWLRPWSLDPDIQRGRDVAEGPSMIIQSGRLSPEFVVVDPGSCVSVRNSDDVTWTLTMLGTPVVVGGGGAAVVCPESNGVFHLKSDAGPFTGGFLIVDPEA